jgi:hypothetical protein
MPLGAGLKQPKALVPFAGTYDRSRFCAFLGKSNAPRACAVAELACACDSASSLMRKFRASALTAQSPHGEMREALTAL